MNLTSHLKVNCVSFRTVHNIIIYIPFIFPSTQNYNGAAVLTLPVGRSVNVSLCTGSEAHTEGTVISIVFSVAWFLVWLTLQSEDGGNVFLINTGFTPNDTSKKRVVLIVSPLLAVVIFIL
jgi:hypothetical protein